MQSLFIAWIFAYFFQSTAHAAPENCASLLQGHIESTASEFIPWGKLEAKMKHRRAATLLIKIPLANVSSPLLSLFSFGDAIKTPVQLITVMNQSLHVVVNGSADEILKLRNDERLKNSSFQVLGSEVSKTAFRMELPEKMVELRDHQKSTIALLRQQIDLSSEARVAILDRKSGQIFFVIPPKDMRTVPLSLVEGLKLSYVEARANNDALDWIVESSSALTDKLIVRTTESYVLSQTAYNTLKTLEGTEMNLVRERTSKVMRDLREELDRCFSPVCVVESVRVAPKPPKEETKQVEVSEASAAPIVPKASGKVARLTSEEVRRLLDFLADYTRIPARKVGLLEKVFSVALSRLLKGEALAQAREKILAIRFLDWDMNNSINGGAAQNRFVDGLIVLGEAAQIPSAEVNSDFVTALIERLSSQQHVGINSNDILRNSGTAPAPVQISRPMSEAAAASLASKSPTARYHSPTLSFARDLFGQDKRMSLDDIENYLTKNHEYSLPTEDGRFKIIYHSASAKQTVSLLFEKSPLRPGVFKFKVMEIQSAPELTQNTFWRELAHLKNVPLHHVKFLQSVMIGGAYFNHANISGSVLLKLQIKHGLHLELIEELLTQFRFTTQSGSDYYADFIYKNRKYRAVFCLEPHGVFLKTVFPQS